MNDKKGLSIASLVCGILSLVMTLFSLFWYPAIIGMVLSIVGLILSIVAKKSGNKSGIATGGLVTSIIGLVLCAILTVACSATMCAVNTLIQDPDFNSFVSELSSVTEQLP